MTLAQAIRIARGLLSELLMLTKDEADAIEVLIAAAERQKETK